MSTFIDFHILPLHHITAPTRITNGPWRGESVSESTSKFESWPLSSGPRIHDIYYEAIRPSFKLWILGEVYSYNNARLKDGRNLVLDSIVQDLNLQKFDPTKMNGHFIMMVYYPEREVWKVYTDRLGTYHMYYGMGKEHNALGTFYRAVTSAVGARQLNEEALSGYFSCGFFLSDTTFLKEVVVLKGSSEYTFDNNLKLVKVSTYWMPSHNPGSISYDDTIDHFAEVIKDVTLDLTTGGRIAIPISGGLDSRTMAAVCTLPEVGSGKEYWSYSYGYSADSVETKIASSIAQARNLSFTGKIISNYLFDKVDEVADSVELFQYIDGTRQADITQEMAQRSDYVIAAHWGDVWFDAMGIQREDDLVSFGLKKLKKKGGDWMVQNILHSSADEASNWVKERVKEQLQLTDNIADPDFRIKMLKTTQWSFRWTLASIRMFQQGAFPRLPFYDNRVVDLFATIPTSFLHQRKLQVDYLKRYHPDLAAITWQEYGSNLFRYKLWNNRMLPYRVLSKLGRMTRGTKTISRNWEIFYLNTEGKRKLTNNLLNSPLTSVVSPDEVQKLLDEFYRNPNGANGYAISMLHTYSIFLKKFFG